MAGRCSDMDPLLDWVEKQTEQIDHMHPNGLVLDLPCLQEVSQQLWSLLGHLVAGDSSMHSVFANCPRHNGPEA